MRDQLKNLQDEVLRQLASVADEAELEQIRVACLGRKGSFTSLVRSIGKLPPDQRPALGKLANQAKQALEARFASTSDRLKSAGRR